MQKVLLIGNGSFIGKNFVKQLRADSEIHAISHLESDFINLRDYRCVVNMAYRPSYFTEPCTEETDFCLQIARRVAAGAAHFIMMSSRKVYGTDTPFPVAETDSLDATDPYGLNNIFTERKVLNLLGDRCTILRPSNVFGWEPGRHTFFGMAISRLLEQKRLVFPFSAFTPRDFLPVQEFARLLAAMIEQRPAGIFNVGSGLALPVGQICLWIMEGFGQGEVIITKPHQFDRFRLDITKLEAALGPQPDLTPMIYESSVAIGRTMREFEASRISSCETFLSQPS